MAGFNKIPIGNKMPAEEGKYIAIRDCTYGIAMYKEGMFYLASGGEFLPKHFEKA